MEPVCPLGRLETMCPLERLDGMAALACLEKDGRVAGMEEIAVSPSCHCGRSGAAVGHGTGLGIFDRT